MSGNINLVDVGAAGGTAGGAYVLFRAVRWLVEWIGGRLDRRQAALEREHGELDQSWKSYRLTLERRLSALETQNAALHLAFQHVSAGLIKIDPQNPALAAAGRVLAAAFPVDFSFSAQVAGAALDEFQRKEERHGHAEA